MEREKSHHQLPVYSYTLWKCSEKKSKTASFQYEKKRRKAPEMLLFRFFYLTLIFFQILLLLAYSH